MNTAAALPAPGIGQRIADALYLHPRVLLFLLLAPPLAWLGVIYLGSLFALLLQSLFYIDEFSGMVVREVSLATYAQLFTLANLDIILRTSTMAAAVTVAAALLAFPLAYYMARYASTRVKAVLYLGVMLPLWSSYLVRVYSWKLILAKEGIITWLAGKLGLTWLLDAVLSIPVIGGPSLSTSDIGTFLVFLYVWLPFMVLPIVAALERVPRSLIEASADLGAGPGADVPQGHSPAGVAGRSRRLDLHLLAHARRLHHPRHRRHLSSLHRAGGVCASRHRRQHSARRGAHRGADRHHGRLSHSGQTPGSVRCALIRTVALAAPRRARKRVGA